MAIAKTFGCIWSLVINGTQLNVEQKRLVSSIDISDPCDGSTTLTVTLNDKYMEIISDDLYVKDATVYASIMFVGDTTKIEFDGNISAIDISFPDSGVPAITITCMDKASHRMNRKKKKRSWTNKTRQDVAKLIAQEYGLKFVGDETYYGTTEETISQSKATDIEFLESMAGEEDELYMCKVIGDTLYYKRKAMLDSPVMTLHYKEYPYEIKSFHPNITKETIQEDENGDINTDDLTVSYATVSEAVNPTTQTVSDAINDASNNNNLTPSAAVNNYTPGGNASTPQYEMVWDSASQSWVRKQK